jgi:hypothetical protein
LTAWLFLETLLTSKMESWMHFRTLTMIVSLAPLGLLACGPDAKNGSPAQETGGTTVLSSHPAGGSPSLGGTSGTGGLMATGGTRSAMGGTNALGGSVVAGNS